eukprot:Blabericola_migrator_1__266@NODE_106_length_14174_cov_318_190118_g94_i0_p10_GENE_NODE_106_length_14174_cov_318_190118_g94_i0NODE_106_length_14174_cov_318_190118_g94_i0_p10_ORF_typecomplete_len104_score6_83_NODE_106_length_14174_cov_318_190118_g94_i084018712
MCVCQRRYVCVCAVQGFACDWFMSKMFVRRVCVEESLQQQFGHQQVFVAEEKWSLNNSNESWIYRSSQAEHGDIKLPHKGEVLKKRTLVTNKVGPKSGLQKDR